MITIYRTLDDDDMPRRVVAGRFDPDRAEKFASDTYWNGCNTIDCNTNSQWDHLALWRTAGGRWVLHRWSAWQGSRETWELVDNDAAMRWCLAAERHDLLDRFWPEISEQEMILTP